MARLPLMWLAGARNGELGAGLELMREIANRLRNHPTDYELRIAAELFERVAEAGADGAAAALYLKHSKRPRQTAREFEIWQAVEEHLERGGSMEDAFRAVAGQFVSPKQRDPDKKLTPGRVKAIFLRWRRAEDESRRETYEQD